MSTPSHTGQPQNPGFAPQDQAATQPVPGYAPGQQMPPNAGPGYGPQDQVPTQPVPGYGPQDQVPTQPAPGYGPQDQVPPNAGPGYGPPPAAPYSGQPGHPGQFGGPGVPSQHGASVAPGQYGQPGGPGQYGQPGVPGQPNPAAQPGFAPNQQFSGPDRFPGAKASFGAALRSEWTKIRTVRSTFWTLLITMVITIGLSSLIALGSSSHPGPDEDFTANSMSGLFFGQLVIVVFGAMAITAEYSTGMIRTALTSQPRRGTLFAAKAVIVAAVALAIGLICSFASFFIATTIYSGHQIHVALSDHNALRAVVGGGLYMCVTALLAFGLGALLRHTAGAITTGVGLLFVLFILVQFLPGSWKHDIGKFIPFNAGMQIIFTRPQDDMLSAWAGFGVFAAYAAAAVIGGAIVIRSKDA